MKVSTFCSGIGSPEQALKNLGVEHENVFACEIDKYARMAYLSNHTPKTIYEDMTSIDMSLPEMYSDLNISGIPCQSFSIAGKRKGELDPRGTLFYNFYEWVKLQQPKYFIIENVKGLLSADGGRIFTKWIDLLSQTVNYQYVMTHEDSLMYNVHYQVLNTKDYGLPQNRERVFIVGIRNDLPNNFRFPLGFPLKLRLKDILETEVDEKYYLSEKMINNLITYKEREREREKGNGFTSKFHDAEKDVMSALKNGGGGCDDLVKIIGNVFPSEHESGNIYDKDGIMSTVKENHGTPGFIEQKGYINQDTQASQVYGTDGVSPSVNAGTHGYAQGYIEEPGVLNFGRNEKAKKIRKENNKKGKDTNPFSEKEVTNINTNNSNTITTNHKDNLIVEPQIIAIRGRGDNNQQQLELNNDGISNSLTTVQKDNLLMVNNINQTCSKRLNETSKEINQFLKENKNGLTINKISKEIGVPKSQVEHYFRVDNSRSIPSPEIWIKLKSLLKFNDQFDKQVTEIYEKGIEYESANRVYNENGISPTIDSSGNGKMIELNEPVVHNMQPRSPNRPSAKRGGSGHLTRKDGITYAIDTGQTNAIETTIGDYRNDEGYIERERGISPTIMASKCSENELSMMPPIVNRIRRLTPKECFRLQGFSDEFFENCAKVNSDTQLYKRAGNSISEPVIRAILKNLLF